MLSRVIVVSRLLAGHG